MNTLKIDLKTAFEAIVPNNLEKKKIIREGLNLDYMILLNRTLANELFNQLRASVEYYDGELTKVRVFGKWHKIPRQQCAYGDAGLNYKFSGVCLPAKEWLPPLIAIRKLLLRVTGYDYNFVLINRYRDGTDHMGEHKDDEAELDPNTPIASLSLGQERPFVFRHGNSRKKDPEKETIHPLKMNLEHGSLLLMNPPTNKFWYHSLPKRKTAPGERINLTFRRINM
ncbi:hypothetical protein HHI36_009166 [Cryptolaemus montrouzieri]|uniref:DNA oxidative demethylase ALKBH2 n=1 Tax=Cryptolaemus montrouzieri TaxID=559131 RepID=A0ABD2MUF6_9CUCU